MQNLAEMNRLVLLWYRAGSKIDTAPLPLVTSSDWLTKASRPRNVSMIHKSHTWKGTGAQSHRDNGEPLLGRAWLDGLDGPDGSDGLDGLDWLDSLELA